MKLWIPLILAALLMGCSTPPVWESHSGDHDSFRTEGITIKAYQVDGFPEDTELEVTCFIDTLLGNYIDVDITAKPFIHEFDDIAIQILWDSDFSNVDVWDARYLDIVDSTSFSPEYQRDNRNDELIVGRLSRFSDMEFMVVTHGQQRVAKFRLDEFTDAYAPIAAYCE